jgi:hypothetical protein
MKKIFKFLIILLLLFSPLVIGFFSFKKFFPEDYTELQEKGKEYLLHKMPLIAYMNGLRKKTAPKAEVKIEEEEIKKEEPIPEIKDFFTNEQIYKIICTDKEPSNKNDKFIGCHQCPNYISKDNLDYFALKYSSEGSFIKKGENELVLFMSGCEDEQQTAIILRRGYGGWQKVATYKSPIFFEDIPLKFHDGDGLNFLIGRKTLTTELEEKETLYSLNFKNNKMNTKDIFYTRSPNTLKCIQEFAAKMNNPIKISEDEFTIQLDVLGWQDKYDSDCKFQTKKPNVTLSPNLYSLIFLKNENKFHGNEATQKIITELEKAQE